MPPAVAADTRPLDANERRVLETLLARDSADKSPAVRLGDSYQALANLVVPRRNDPTHQGDLVYAGEIVNLTGEEAALFLRHGDKDGRQVPVIRRWDGPDGSKEPVQRILPRFLSGRVWRPAQPAPGMPDDYPRPDPEGSSRISYATSVPESAEPQPGSESDAGDLNASAVDLPPGTANVTPEGAAAVADRAARNRAGRAR